MPIAKLVSRLRRGGRSDGAHPVSGCLIPFRGIKYFALDFLAWSQGVGFGPAGSAHLTNDEVLTVKEVATILELAEKTVYSMAQRGELPTFKVRGQWRIRRTDLGLWVEQQPKGEPLVKSRSPSKNEGSCTTRRGRRGGKVKLEDLQPKTVVRGILPDCLVTV